MYYGTKRVMKIKKIYCNFVIICCYIANAKAKQRYDLKADELMESILKDTYKGKFQHRFPSPKNITQVTSKSITSTAQTKLPYVRTTHAIPLAKLENDMTVEQFFLRKRDLDLGTILESTVKHIPNFESEEDEITTQTRRYNGIKESHRRMNSLREIYFDQDNATIILKEKTQTLNLMAQFVYETRYHLPYAQLLRKKYKKHLKYQLGYCFALIRHLKQQQMVLYSTLKSYYGRKNDDSQVIMSLFTHLKLFEKIVKLDVDIKDLIKLILQLDKRRKQLSTTESVSSTKFRPQ